MIIADQGHPAVGVGTHHADGAEFLFVQRQDAVVFQQDDALFRRLNGSGNVLPALHGAVGNGIKLGFLAVHNAQQIPGSEQPDGSLTDILFRNQLLGQGGEQAAIGAAAVQVGAGLQGGGAGLGGSIGEMVIFVEIPDGPAVGNHMTLEAPFVPQIFLKQLRAAAAGIAVDCVVGAHDGLHIGFLHRRFKGGQVGFLHVLFAGVDIEVVPLRLGAGVDRKMLGAGGGFQVFPVSLQAPDIGLAQLGGQGGVLAIGLMAPAPAGVTENIDVGGPEGQTLIDIPVSLFGQGVVLGPALGGGDVSKALHHIRVKGRCHADGLGEAGGDASPGHAVKGLVPPVVFRDVQAVQGRSVIAQLGGCFQHIHLGNQCFGHFLCFCAVHLSSPFAMGVE